MHLGEARWVPRSTGLTGKVGTGAVRRCGSPQCGVDACLSSASAACWWVGPICHGSPVAMEDGNGSSGLSPGEKGMEAERPASRIPLFWMGKQSPLQHRSGWGWHSHERPVLLPSQEKNGGSLHFPSVLVLAFSRVASKATRMCLCLPGFSS